MEVKKGKNMLFVGESETNSIARITWKNGGSKVIVVDHSFVDPSLRGQGVAKLLLASLVDMAREQQLKVVPACTFVQRKLTQSDEYKDILF